MGVVWTATGRLEGVDVDVGGLVGVGVGVTLDAGGGTGAGSGAPKCRAPVSASAAVPPARRTAAPTRPPMTANRVREGRAGPAATVSWRMSRRMALRAGSKAGPVAVILHLLRRRA